MKYNVGDIVEVTMELEYSAVPLRYKVRVKEVHEEDEAYTVAEIDKQGNESWLYGEIYDEDDNHVLYKGIT